MTTTRTYVADRSPETDITIATVTYNLSMPKDDPDAYRASYVTGETGLKITARLIQHPIVWNNVVTYIGVFATPAEARGAVHEYIDAP
jgi:hypothetical protein